MTAEELVEKVARAIREAPMRRTMNPRSIDPEAPLSDADMQRAIDALRVVREAMAEPSDAMCDAGFSKVDFGQVAWSDIDRCWRAMLAAHPISRIGE